MTDIRDAAIALALRGGKIGLGIKLGVAGAVLMFVMLLFIAPFVGTSGGIGSAQAGCPVAGGVLPEPLPGGNIHAKQLVYARTIDQVRQSLHMPGKATLIAFMAGLDESTLQNLANPKYPETIAAAHDGIGSNANSIGLLQQQPDQGWGQPLQLLDPRYATRAFLVGPPGHPKGLGAVAGWENMSPTSAIHAVQRNTDPGVYAPFEQPATSLAAELGIDITTPGDPTGGVTPSVGPAVVSAEDPTQGCGSGADSASPFAQEAIAAARSQLGQPYVWAAGGYNGPTMGGFDCSGLMMFAIAQASAQRIQLPHSSQQQRLLGKAVQRPDLQPGDVIVFDLPGSTDGAWGHVGLFIGNGQMIHAPTEGVPVQVAQIIGSGYWAKAGWDIRRFS